jgi:hypothetical protein
MDVWFCVPPQEPKTKRYERNCKNIHQPAPSERGTKILAFPLTLLIMDVRVVGISDTCSRDRNFGNHFLRKAGYSAKWITSGLRVIREQSTKWQNGGVRLYMNGGP